MTGRIALDRAARRGRYPTGGMALLLVLTCLASQATSAPAADSAPLTILDVRAGFAGRFKVGYWTPFEVSLRCGQEAVSGELELTVPDGDTTAVVESA